MDWISRIVSSIADIATGRLGKSLVTAEQSQRLVFDVPALSASLQNTMDRLRRAHNTEAHVNNTETYAKLTGILSQYQHTLQEMLARCQLERKTITEPCRFALNAINDNRAPFFRLSAQIAMIDKLLAGMEGGMTAAAAEEWTEYLNEDFEQMSETLTWMDESVRKYTESVWDGSDWIALKKESRADTGLQVVRGGGRRTIGK